MLQNPHLHLPVQNPFYAAPGIHCFRLAVCDRIQIGTRRVEGAAERLQLKTGDARQIGVCNSTDGHACELAARQTLQRPHQRHQ